MVVLFLLLQHRVFFRMRGYQFRYSLSMHHIKSPSLSPSQSHRCRNDEICQSGCGGNEERRAASCWPLRAWLSSPNSEVRCSREGAYLHVARRAATISACIVAIITWNHGANVPGRLARLPTATLPKARQAEKTRTAMPMPTHRNRRLPKAK